MLRFFANSLSVFLPVFRFYKFRQWLLSLARIDVARGAKINGHTVFYGRGPISIEENTWIGPGCKFYSHEDAPILIGANCDIAPEVSFITGSHDIAGSDRRAGAGKADGITIYKGCWIGARVTILGGVSIGEGAVVAAGAVVNHNLPGNCIAGGVPARVIKILDDGEVGKR